MSEEVASAGTNAGPRMMACQECGKQVSEMSMTLHKITACNARARRPSAQQHPQVEENDAEPMEVDNDNCDEENEDPNNSLNRKVSASSSATGDYSSSSSVSGAKIADDDAISISSEGESSSEVVEIPSTPRNGARRRRRRLSPSVQQPQDNDILQVSDVVDLVDNNPENNNDNQWACPQCTLLNPKTLPTCGACHYHNADIRPPDPTRTERLLGNDNVSSPLAYVSGGALLGGMLGAAGSLLHGRDPLMGAAEGAMTGGIGGAFLQDVLSSPNVSSTAVPEQNQNPNIAQARSSAALGMAGYPSMGGSLDLSNRRARPRPSYRVAQQIRADGTTTTIINGGNGSTRITRSSMSGNRRGSRSNTPDGMNDQMLSLILHSYMQQGGAAIAAGAGGGRQPGNIDGMNYDQLLQAFGDGSENLGAEEHQIQQLPTKVLGNPETELPEDARQCLICLEDFAAGETRKTLPCLHGFHEHCADKWLRSNGSCPCCKHKIG